MPEPPAQPAPENATRPDHHGSGVDHSVQENKPKKPLRNWLLRSSITLVLLAVLLIALAPTLLSTGPGTRWLVSVVSDKLPGELIVEDLSLSWFGGQHVEGVTYGEMTDAFYIQIGTVDAGEVGLFELLTGGRRLGEVVLQDVVVTSIVPGDAADPSGEQSGSDTSEEKQPLSLPPGLSGTLTIKNLTANYQPYQREVIQLALTEDQIKVSDIRDIAFDFDAALRQGEKAGRVVLAGTVLNLFDPDGVEQAGQAFYDIKLTVEDAPTATLDQLVSGLVEGVRPGQLVALLGDGDVESSATINGTIEELKSDLEITTPNLRVELDQITEDKMLIASPKSYARLELDQAGFAALFPNSGLKLVETTGIALSSLQMKLPIIDRAVDWGGATASMLLKADDNLAVIDPRGEVLGIDELRIAGGSESIAEKLAFKFSTTLSAVDRAGKQTREPVVVELVVLEPLEATRQIDFFSQALPIRLADALAGQEGRLPLWLGEMLELQADLRGKVVTDADGGTRIVQQFALRPQGRVNGTVSGSFDGGNYSLSTPKNEPVQAVLVPEAFASLMEMLTGKPGEPALTIDKPMPVFLTLRDPERGEVSITTRKDKQGLKRFYPDPDRTYVGATIELSPARVFDPKQKKTYELRGGKLSLSAPDLRGRTEIKAELDLWVRPDAGEQGVSSLLTWQTTVTDLLDTEGAIPLDGQALMDQIGLNGGMKLKNAPSGLMDTLLNRSGDLSSVLGPIVQRMDAGFTYTDGRPTGATVRLNWDDKNNQPLPGVSASMKPAAFDIDDQQMLTVRGGQDLELEVRVTEAFGDRWMGQLHPILFDAKSGDRPVKIKINGGSFKFPLNDTGMKGAHVEAQVDLGSVEFGDDALLGKLLEWTGRPGERAVFEPAKVSLIDGKVAYDQFDLAVGKVKLRLDGEVDLASGQIVDMAVRVPGDSLIRVFNELDGVIAADDFLSIPMSGAIRKPKFDQKLIGREVARMVARGLIEKQKDKLGDLIRKEVGGDDEDKDKPDGDAKDPAQEAAEELIDGVFDLFLNRRRGGADEGNE